MLHSLFVTGKSFQPSLMVVSKVRAYPTMKLLLGATFSLFVPGKYFHPSLMIVIEVGAYPTMKLLLGAKFSILVPGSIVGLALGLTCKH